MAKRGRPKKPPDELKAAQVGIRMPTDLRDRLAEAARSAGRTISQEVEQRLWRSFDERAQAANFGGEITFWTFRMIAEVLSLIEEVTDKRWWESRWVFDQFQELFEFFTLAFRPPGKSVPPGWHGLKAAEARHQGRVLAEQMLREIETIARVPGARWDISRHRSARVEASRYLVPLMKTSPNEEAMHRANPGWGERGRPKIIIHTYDIPAPKGKRKS